MHTLATCKGGVPQNGKALLSQLKCNIASDDALDTSYATPPSEDVRGLTATFTEDEASSSSFGEGHRPKQVYSDTNFMGLITRTIPANPSRLS